MNHFFKEYRKTIFTLSSLIILSVFISSIGYLKFYRHHLDVPSGCDEFGYLQLADAFSRNVTFDDHISRSFVKPLIKALEESGFGYEDYAWMIAPHAYHVEKNTKKIINQYPPGISYLMSWVEKDDRQVMFSFIVSLILISFPLLAIYFLPISRNQKLTGFYSAVILVLIFFTTSPFMLELHRVNSVAPTYGLLLAAGILFRSRPTAALFLIGTSVLFRISNILIAVPIFFYFLLENLRFGKEFYKQFIFKGIKGTVAIFFGGVFLYLIYVFLLLGNPLLPTYSVKDQEVAFTQELIRNIKYYLSFDQKWFVANLIPLIIISVLFFKRKLPGKYYIFISLIPLINYLFFITHRVKISYYPYASSILLLGVLVEFISTHVRIKVNYHKFILAFGMALLIAVFGKSWKDQKRDHLKIYQKKRVPIESCFKGYDVVWAEIHSSTVEYVNGNAGFRYVWGPEKTRKYVMNWLKDNGYTQAIWTDDIKLSNIQLENFLNRSRLPYHHKKCDALGSVYTIGD